MLQLFVVILVAAGMSTIIGFDDFEFEMKDDNGIFTDNMINPGILEAKREYYVIQKVEFEQKDLPKDNTKINGTVGYAFHHGDKMIRPPMGENVTNEEKQEFMRNLSKNYEEFRKTSTTKDSYEFIIGIKNPFYIKFPIKFEQLGLYTYQFYQKTDLKEGPGGASMGGLVVVGKYSKALDDDGLCRTEGLTRTIKYDYSTVVYTSLETHHELRDRGWGIR